MTFQNLAENAAAIVAALGGGGAIVLGTSSWLGKLWAERLMHRERAEHERELERFKHKLIAEHERELERLKHRLIADRDRDSATHREKLALYKEVFTPLIGVIAHIEMNQPSLQVGDLIEFEKQRLQTTAMLGMFADVQVFDAYNDVLDYILDCLDNVHRFEFADFRRRGLVLLSKIRQDVGIAGDELVYRGTRY